MVKEIKHIAIILDGNRRYAKSKGLPAWEGHRLGGENVKKLLTEWIIELKIKELTLYTFSIQNFERSEKEVKFLMKLFKDWLKFIDIDECREKGVKINFIGRIQLFSRDLQKMMEEVMEKTKGNSKHIVNFAMGYGGREEIVDAVNKILKEGKLKKVDEKIFSKYLYLQSEPDLIIRTGGARRTSNFLIWQSWYSEWFFVEKFWPEFEKEDLIKIIEEYKKRERKFGK